MTDDTDDKPDAIEKGQAKEFITAPEKAKRRQVLSRIMWSGLSDDDIYEIMGRPRDQDGFGMDRDQVKKLIDEVYAMWATEKAAREPYIKELSINRILDHIRKAGKEGSWTAVANMEKVLAQILGTYEPVEVVQHTSARIDEAVLKVLGETEESELRRMIADERKLFEAHDQSQIPKLVDVTPKRESTSVTASEPETVPETSNDSATVENNTE
jgi:hypothetical protein